MASTYPAHLERTVDLADGTPLLIRPIRPDDAERERAFDRSLSARSRYLRFLYSLKGITPEMVRRFTCIDYATEMAFVALAGDVQAGVARMHVDPDGRGCEFAIVVADAWQRRGIGARLMEALLDDARARGLRAMRGDVLSSNGAMFRLMERLGFRIGAPDAAGVCRVHVRL